MVLFCTNDRTACFEFSAAQNRDSASITAIHSPASTFVPQNRRRLTVVNELHADNKLINTLKTRCTCAVFFQKAYSSSANKKKQGVYPIVYKHLQTIVYMTLVQRYVYLNSVELCRLNNSISRCSTRHGDVRDNWQNRALRGL